MNRKQTKLYLTDDEINKLIKEKKYLSNSSKITNLKGLYGHLKGSKIKLIGEDDHIFELRTRIITTADDNFSVILSVILDETKGTFRLLRYNGFHQHKNKIENQQLDPGFHIHKATERYQTSKYRKHDGFAEITDKYDTMFEALRNMIVDCNIELDKEDQTQHTLI